MSNDKYLEFVKSFKVALTNCSVYFPKHPIFSQSIISFKEKIDYLAGENLSLTVKIKPDSLIVAKQVLEDNATKELSATLHQKKIKSIVFQKEVITQDLSIFLVSLSSNIDDILSGGGLRRLLKNKKVKSIQVEDLDYSSLLEGKGEQIKNVWGYLFSLQQEQGGEDSPENFLENFKETVDKFGVKEVLEDENLSELLVDLFSKLQSQTETDLKKTLKKLSESILKTRNLNNVKNKEKLKKLFSRFESGDLADLLSNLFQANISLDQSSFDLFSFLVPSEIHEKTAKMLKDKYQKNEAKPEAEGIQNVFSSLKDEGAVPLYRKHLSIDTGVKPSGFKLDFSYDHLKENYRLSLLDLFFYENDFSILDSIVDKIAEEIQDDPLGKMDYIKQFIKIYQKKLKSMDANLLYARSKKIWACLEKDIFIRGEIVNFNFLTDLLDSSSLDSSFYLDKINSGDFNSLVLQLFFKFFPQKVSQLQEIILTKKNDFSFLRKVIANLEKVDSPAVLGIFREVYSGASFSIKIEVLNRLKNYSYCDQDFLMSIVKSSNFYLRKKAVEAAVKFSQLRQQVVENLLSLSNFLGFNSKTILENLDILEQAYVVEAKPFLEKLSSSKFFWNKKIREKSLSLLKNNN